MAENLPKSVLIHEVSAEKEVIANKKTDLADDSDTYYASQKAVKNFTIAMAIALGMP